ncbi:MAG: hypothetical protein A2580_13305 [Hydrogenophilales bacterium RIFOXYD1_FULL_62_11]|nr:MAG: hypothetical protein A2580_13305 [Hydrogenophilales bacterium RIFOXYD1_FULL_62_11]
MKTLVEAYLNKAKLLPEKEIERLLSRMRGKLMRRLEDTKLGELEVAAFQLAIEAEALNEWREKMAEIREKTKAE